MSYTHNRTISGASMGVGVTPMSRMFDIGKKKKVQPEKADTAESP